MKSKIQIIFKHKLKCSIKILPAVTLIRDTSAIYESRKIVGPDQILTSKKHMQWLLNGRNLEK